MDIHTKTGLIFMFNSALLSSFEIPFTLIQQILCYCCLQIGYSGKFVLTFLTKINKYIWHSGWKNSLFLIQQRWTCP